MFYDEPGYDVILQVLTIEEFLNPSNFPFAAINDETNDVEWERYTPCCAARQPAALESCVKCGKLGGIWHQDGGINVTAIGVNIKDKENGGQNLYNQSFSRRRVSAIKEW